MSGTEQGVPYSRAQAITTAGGAGLLFHDLRHTATRWRAQVEHAGADAPGGPCGHTSGQHAPDERDRLIPDSIGDAIAEWQAGQDGDGPPGVSVPVSGNWDGCGTAGETAQKRGRPRK